MGRSIAFVMTHGYLITHPEELSGLPAVALRDREVLLVHRTTRIQTSLSIFRGRGSCLLRRVQSAGLRPAFHWERMTVGSQAIVSRELASEVVGRLQGLTAMPRPEFHVMIDGEICEIHRSDEVARFYVGGERTSSLSTQFFREFEVLDALLPWSTTRAMLAREID